MTPEQVARLKVNNFLQSYGDCKSWATIFMELNMPEPTFRILESELTRMLVAALQQVERSVMEQVETHGKYLIEVIYPQSPAHAKGVQTLLDMCKQHAEAKP